jgi:hypothetical protein
VNEVLEIKTGSGSIETVLGLSGVIGEREPPKDESASLGVIQTFMLFHTGSFYFSISPCSQSVMGLSSMTVQISQKNRNTRSTLFPRSN